MRETISVLLILDIVMIFSPCFLLLWFFLKQQINLWKNPLNKLFFKFKFVENSLWNFQDNTLNPCGQIYLKTQKFIKISLLAINSPRYLIIMLHVFFLYYFLFCLKNENKFKTETRSTQGIINNTEFLFFQ